MVPPIFVFLPHDVKSNCRVLAEKVGKGPRLSLPLPLLGTTKQRPQNERNKRNSPQRDFFLATNEARYGALTFQSNSGPWGAPGVETSLVPFVCERGLAVLRSSACLF